MQWLPIVCEGQDWSATRCYCLATGSADKSVRLWRVTCSTKTGLSISPLMSLDTLATHILCLNTYLDYNLISERDPRVQDAYDTANVTRRKKGIYSFSLIESARRITTDMSIGGKHYREKSISDGVSSKTRSLFIILQELIASKMNTTPENIKTIQELKINPPLQYINTSIATPLNSIVKGTANATQNQTTNVNAPLGISLNIDKGTWGQAPYKYNDVTSSTSKVETYNPEKIVVKDGKTIKYAAGYSTKDVTTTKSTPKTVDQMKDVTQIDRNQVNSGSSLNISPTQYSSLYTNPVDPRNTNPGVNNNYVEYSYRPDQTKYTDKNIFLDNDFIYLFLNSFPEILIPSTSIQ
jgi:hypothetical protein